MTGFFPIFFSSWLQSSLNVIGVAYIWLVMGISFASLTRNYRIICMDVFGYINIVWTYGLWSSVPLSCAWVQIREYKTRLEYPQTSLPPYTAITVLNFPAQNALCAWILRDRVVGLNVPPIYFVTYVHRWSLVLFCIGNFVMLIHLYR